MPRDELLGEALRLIDHGRQVFILGRSKRPVANCPHCRDAGPEHDPAACDHLLCHGLYAATLDPDRVRAMLRAVPGGMLAERTGAASGIVVIDIDTRHDGAIQPDLMPRTQLMRTHSGDPHLIYRHPGGTIPNSAGRIAPGIDVRADGGYHVVPPSVHPGTGRRYRWCGDHPPVEMPPALLAACLPPAATVTTGTRPTTTSTGRGISDPDALLASILARVTSAPEGARRSTLYGAARGVARMVTAGCLSRDDAWRVLTAAGEQAQQTTREIRRAIEGGFGAEGVRP